MTQTLVYGISGVHHCLCLCLCTPFHCLLSQEISLSHPLSLPPLSVPLTLSLAHPLSHSPPRSPSPSLTLSLPPSHPPPRSPFLSPSRSRYLSLSLSSSLSHSPLSFSLPRSPPLPFPSIPLSFSQIPLLSSLTIFLYLSFLHLICFPSCTLTYLWYNLSVRVHYWDFYYDFSSRWRLYWWCCLSAVSTSFLQHIIVQHRGNAFTRFWVLGNSDRWIQWYIDR